MARQNTYKKTSIENIGKPLEGDLSIFYDKDGNKGIVDEEGKARKTQSIPYKGLTTAELLALLNPVKDEVYISTQAQGLELCMMVVLGFQRHL